MASSTLRDDHAALGGGVRPVVHRAERRSARRRGNAWCSGCAPAPPWPGRSWRSVSRAAFLLGVGHHALGRSGIHAAPHTSPATHGGAELRIHLEAGNRSRSPLSTRASTALRQSVRSSAMSVSRSTASATMLLEQAAVRLAHAHGQAVVEVAHRLAAVLVVLVATGWRCRQAPRSWRCRWARAARRGPWRSRP